MKNVSVLIGNNIIETLNFENPVCNSYILGLSAKTKLLTLNDEGSNTIIVYSGNISSKFELKKYYTCSPVEHIVPSVNEDKRFEKYEVCLDCYKKFDDVSEANYNNANLPTEFILENGIVYGLFSDFDSIKLIKIRLRLLGKKQILGQAEVNLLLGTNKMIYDVALDFDLKNLYFSNREKKTIIKPSLSSSNSKGNRQKENSFSNNDVLFTNYLQEAFEIIDKEYKSKQSDSKSHCLVSIHIVMPNNLGCHRLLQEMQKIQKYLNTIMNPNYASIAGFDVSVLYESDVSFADVFSDNFKEGHYLIIDLRKNDLDFSAINFTSDPIRILHLYRDVILGAGNALSYAMLLVILRGFLNAEKPGIKPEESEPLIKQFIFEKILGTNDTELLEELLQLLDRYKAKYYGLTESASFEALCLGYNDFGNLSLTKLVQKIKYFDDNNLFIYDFGNYMNRMMDSLTESILEKINRWFALGYFPTNPQIITTDGDFFLSPFRKMITERIEALLSSHKKVCLEKEMSKKEIKPQTIPPQRKLSFVSGIFNPDPAIAFGPEITIKQPKEDNLMNLMSYDDQIQIAYFRYPLPPDLQKTRPFDIFFIDGEIWIKRGNHFSKYIPSDSVNKHVFETEFPYHQVSNSKDVVIPPVNK